MLSLFARHGYVKLVAIAVVIFTAIGFAWLLYQNRKVDPLLTISTGTTRIVTPLKSSGYPDYIQALNDAARGTTTPERNGAIPLFEAGASEIYASEDIAIAKLLGVPDHDSTSEAIEWWSYLSVLPRKRFPLATDADRDELAVRLKPDGNHDEPIQIIGESSGEEPPPAVDAEVAVPEPRISAEALPGEQEGFMTTTEREETLRDIIIERYGRHEEEFRARAWTAAEFPLAAEWLKSLAPRLTQLEKIRARTDFFTPIPPGDEPVLLILFQPHAKDFQKWVAAYQSRAMLRLGSGDLDAAFADAMIIQHIAGLCRKTLWLNDHLVAKFYEINASECLAQILLHPEMDRRRLTRYRDEYRRLLEPIDLIPTLDVGERFRTLQLVASMAEFGPEVALHEINLIKKFDSANKRQPLADRVRLDYDLILARINIEYDQLVAILRIADSSQREQAAMNHVRNSHFRNHRHEDYETILSRAWTLPQWRSEELGDALLDDLVSLPTYYNEHEKRARVGRELAELSFYLVESFQKNGRYPADLDEAIAKLSAESRLVEVRKSMWKYGCDGPEFLLYEFGPNGRDDGGLFDDLVISTPKLKPVEKPVEPVLELESIPD